MKRSDLFREYARVIDMCEGTGIAEYKGVKQNHEVLCDHARFDRNPDTYAFAIGMCEGKPVFAGDTLYDSSGNEWTVRYARDNFNEYSWTKPEPVVKTDTRIIHHADYVDTFICCTWTDGVLTNVEIVR